MKIIIPIKLDSIANLSHMHWRSITKIKNAHKMATWGAFSGKEIPDLPVRVTFTRVGKRKLLDDDNLKGAFKYVRDTIAGFYETDDGNTDQYEWKYEQRLGDDWAIEIEIESINIWNQDRD